MTGRHLAESILLFAGVGAELVCVLGIVVMRSSINRLHFLSASSTLGPILIAAAVVTKQLLESMGVKAVLVAGILAVTGPTLTHAMANAIRVRGRGRLDIRPTEEVSAP